MGGLYPKDAERLVSERLSSDHKEELKVLDVGSGSGIWFVVFSSPGVPVSLRLNQPIP